MNNKDATLVTNNGIDYRYASIYDKDDDDTTSGGLMNDRQGSMDIGEDAGNISYYGADPNNYIYFNCDDYNNPSDTTCELWRIIGIVDGKVKIARDSVLSSTMAWNTAGNNNWSTASLNTYLNGDYYESLRTKNPDTLDLISMSTWYLGGYSTTSGLYANDIYGYERKNEVGTTIYSGNPPSIEANIGLMYASDYGYATDLSVCDKDIYNYDTSANCKDKDWLFKSNGTNTNQWLITPHSSDSSYAWHLDSLGYVNGGYGVAGAFGVRAVLYLNSELVIETGDGSKDTPYVVR